ncbi:hypothetical protein Tco_0780851 [Tanacetum coccineum]
MDFAPSPHVVVAICYGLFGGLVVVGQGVARLEVAGLVDWGGVRVLGRGPGGETRVEGKEEGKGERQGGGQEERGGRDGGASAAWLSLERDGRGETASAVKQGEGAAAGWGKPRRKPELGAANRGGVRQGALTRGGGRRVVGGATRRRSQRGDGTGGGEGGWRLGSGEGRGGQEGSRKRDTGAGAEGGTGGKREGRVIRWQRKEGEVRGNRGDRAGREKTATREGGRADGGVEGAAGTGGRGQARAGAAGRGSRGGQSRCGEGSQTRARQGRGSGARRDGEAVRSAVASAVYGDGAAREGLGTWGRRAEGEDTEAKGRATRSGDQGGGGERGHRTRQGGE